MDSKKYIKDAGRTEQNNYSFPDTGELSARTEHAIMGIVTEAGELMDIVKKVKINNKALDKSDLVDEAGDIMWYLALLCDDLGVSFEEVWEKNIKKLKTRFPEKYTDERAINKDKEKEKKIFKK